MITEGRRIEGKIAAILSKREAVLNIGSADGVELGMRFVILNRRKIDVRDPDSGEVLAQIEVPKTVVKVVRIDTNVCVVRTFRTIDAVPGIFGANLGGAPARTETLDIEAGTSLKAQLRKEERQVNVGDIALVTKGEEYDEL